MEITTTTFGPDMIVAAEVYAEDDDKDWLASAWVMYLGSTPKDVVWNGRVNCRWAVNMVTYKTDDAPEQYFECFEDALTGAEDMVHKAAEELTKDQEVE